MRRPSQTKSILVTGLAPRGYSLVEVLVAAGIVSILALAIMTVFAWSFEGQRTILQRQSALDLQNTLSNLLADRKMCELNFQGRSVLAGAADTLTDVISDKGPPRKAVIAEGNAYENNTVSVKNITLSNFKPYATTAPDRFRGTMTVNVQLEPLSQTLGATNLLRTVTLLVETNGYPPATAGNAMDIRSCVALGSDQNSIWTKNSAGEVYYSGYNVGIGTTLPTQALHVEGKVLATTFFHSSDERLKMDIRPAPGLAALKHIRGVRFRWRSTGQESMGVIAQDVEKVFPEAVSTNPRTNVKSVSYDQLIGPLIESVNELSRDNARLARQIEAFEKTRDGR